MVSFSLKMAAKTFLSTSLLLKRVEFEIANNRGKDAAANIKLLDEAA